jgi:bis(5'-adenosyl)-triphosphatase
VPHVHVHIIPRKREDYRENDEIYNDLEKSEWELKTRLSHRMPKIEDKDRISRTDEEMAKEAAWLAKYFEQITC